MTEHTLALARHQQPLRLSLRVAMCQKTLFLTCLPFREAHEDCATYSLQDHTSSNARVGSYVFLQPQDSIAHKEPY
jgi:hypothetical protein